MRHNKYAWIFTTFAVVLVLGVYFQRESIRASAYTFAQNSWLGGVAVATSTHPGDQTGWTTYESKTADIVAATTVSLLGTSVSATDDIATSTTSTLSITGGGFNNGTLTSTATTTGGVLLNSLDTLRPMVSAGPMGNKALILKTDGTVWQQGDTIEYTTWNPLDTHPEITLSDNNLTATHSSAWSWESARAGLGKSSGKWYWESTFVSGPYHVVGIGYSSAILGSYAGYGTDSWGYFNVDGSFNNNATPVPGGAAFANGDVIGVALDYYA